MDVGSYSNRNTGEIVNKAKQALLIGAGVVAIGAAGMGVTATTSALSGDSSNPDQTLIDKLVSKFNLSESDVQSVFDEVHSARESDMKANREAALKKALKNDKITQAQYNYITSIWAKMDALHDGNRTDANHKKMHNLMEKLRKWMDAQNIDRSVLGTPPRGPGGPGERSGDQSSSAG